MIRIFLSRLIVVCAAGLPCISHAEDADKILQKRISDHWIQVSRDYAETYKIRPAEQGSTPFRLYDDPVFQHIQAVRGNDIGAVHLWTDEQNRPAAIATVFAWTTSDSTRMVFNELHSLSDRPIRATRNDKPHWNSQTAGTFWKAVPGALDPKTSSRLRRLQLNAMAKKFTSHTVDPAKNRFQLRQIPSPIFEYEVKGDKLRSGALYAFAQGTDIEAMVWMEVRYHQKKPRWEFTCVKFTDYRPHILYGQKDVWKPFEDEYRQDGNPHFWAPLETKTMPQFEQDYRQSLSK